MTPLLTHPNRKQRGQTLIIAIMVMFILAVVATVFIALVARNLFRSERYSKTDVVTQIAEAGVRYADQMLTTSEEGADWRPAPDNVGLDTSVAYDPANLTPDTGTNLGGTMPNWKYLRDKHPDFKWVRPYSPTEQFPSGYTATSGEIGFAGPTGGFTTYNCGQGRYLLRISYNPNPKDPMTKYIRIDSIGRFGTVDYDPASNTFDPTTLKPYGDVQLRREVTAYKPIGITDYARFITNKDNRTMDLSLGAPGFKITYGRAGVKAGSSSNYIIDPRGGPIRVNGNLMWYGAYSAMPGNDIDDASKLDSNPGVELFLRTATAHGEGDAAGSPTEIVPRDRVEVAGDINVDEGTMPNGGAGIVRVRLNAIDPNGDVTSRMGLSSKSSGFETFSGLYRDGSDMGDNSKDASDKPTPLARGVKRIEPPLVDGPDASNTTTRYRLLTLNSGERIRAGNTGRWINLGQYGWGRGIYINNSRDWQDESHQTLVGGFTLRADWLNPSKMLSSSWKGPYYCPPGVIITLSADDYEDVSEGANTYRQYYFTMTRTDTASNGQKSVWYDCMGNARPDWGQTIRMPYPDPKHGRTFTTAIGGDRKKHIEGNGVIYAEGNIRIRGMLPPGMNLTVVSGRTIYIEGNLLKYRNRNISSPSRDPWKDADKSCGLALLARDNVCVNTTQFFSGDPDVWGSDAENDQPPYHTTVNADPDSRVRSHFEFGPWESETSSTNPGSDRALFLRHSGEYGPTYINAWLFQDGYSTDWLPLYLNWDSTTGNVKYPILPNHIWGVGDPNFNNAGWGISTAYAGDVFSLSDILRDDPLYVAPGLRTFLQIGLDQTTYTQRNYWMGGLAVQPEDIRIEAVIYAQEGSFFVIPGQWFNPNPSDTRAAFLSGNPRPGGVRDTFPFYGEPLDIRVIIDGAVSENLPAQISDVEEWMSKWGNIPDTYGSSDRSTAHPGEGLTFLYDDCVGWPLLDQSQPNKPIRTDKFGRALPIAPKLPVSGSLIYFGDVM